MMGYQDRYEDSRSSNNAPECSIMIRVSSNKFGGSRAATKFAELARQKVRQPESIFCKGTVLISVNYLSDP